MLCTVSKGFQGTTKERSEVKVKKSVRHLGPVPPGIPVGSRGQAGSDNDDDG